MAILTNLPTHDSSGNSSAGMNNFSKQLPKLPDEDPEQPDVT